MDRVRAERTQVRRLFTIAAKKVENLLEQETPDLGDVLLEFNKLEDKSGRLFLLDQQVSDKLFEEAEGKLSENDLILEFDTVEAYRETWISICTKKDKLIERDRVSSPAMSEAGVTVISAKDHIGFKFPKLELRKFDIKPKTWISFWACFRKFHESTELDLEDKFQLLLRMAQDGTAAKELLDSFPPSASNYEKAITLLKSRFGRDELLIDLYVRELLRLVLLQSSGKTSISLAQLFDRLETQLMALESLGVASEKYASMLYPMVESALPESVLREWERRRVKSVDRGSLLDGSVRMTELRSFLREEVESEERLSLARKTFSSTERDECNVKTKNPKSDNTSLPKQSTAADLVSFHSQSRTDKCLFCGEDHSAQFCFKARQMNVDAKFDILKTRKCCFRCLDTFHGKTPCRTKLHCIICTRHHATVMCPTLKSEKNTEGDSSLSGSPDVDLNCSNTDCAPVLMQTLKVQLKGEIPRTARLLIDSGSQRSYITERLAKAMDYKTVRVEKLVHALFGGGRTELKTHHCYKVRLQSTTSMYSCMFDVLDSDSICHAVPAIPKGPWMSELQSKKITLSDTTQGPIDILVGADVAGKLLTGRREVLSCGLVAVETSLGWTVMGRIRDSASSFMSNVSSLCALDLPASDLWRLDVIGIEDPAEVSTKEEARTAAQEHFLNTVKILEDGRYEVSLPWLVGHPTLPRNFKLASSRLQSTLKKLHSSSLMADYGAVFHEWLQEGIIEEVPVEDWDSGHYLPHRPVVKEGSTTRIRPVFDASAHEKNQPNLNQCLEKGDNMIELIPSMLLRFRFQRIGVIADIRKAFLQISIDACDRDALRFLWNDSSGNLVIYRHRRVVFGVKSSPYLLGAVINHHLAKYSKRAVVDGDISYSELVISKLKRGLYVDNCVTSLEDQDSVKEFMEQSKAIFREAQFDLRGWEWSDPALVDSTATAVLGMLWDRKNDVLKVNPPSFQDFDAVQVTRRSVLSAVQKVFDPVGICSPATLVPKLLIQDSWTDGGSWDTPLKESSTKKFMKWMAEVSAFNEIDMPRWIRSSLNNSKMALHTFCDASQSSYAAVSFLRVETDNSVFVTVLGAKSRVAPLNKVTIPRLELLAATIGARLGSSIVKELSEVQQFFWSDSSTVLSWIRREEPWGVFVFNRVREIRCLTQQGIWKHIPGISNPADLLSRGCSPRELLESRWWEGPQWLYNSPDEWPLSHINPNEEEVLAERRKLAVVAVTTCQREFNSGCLDKFSKFSRTVRLVGWMLRYLFNRFSKKPRRTGNLHICEIERAEKVVLKMIQGESFNGVKDKTLHKLKPQTDSTGLIRLRTKIWARKDTEDFRTPVILPPKHYLVTKLILEIHMRNGHVVGQTLLNLIRERYWVVRGRQVIKGVVAQCSVCKRFMAKSLEVETPPLPETRVRDANIFEICGTDLAGPLYLSNGNKVWLCFFTCAVYRAVHVELVSSQSTEAFMLAFRRFVALRGRPSIVYSDNGRNFWGARNALFKVDWSGIAAQGATERIEWRFNPPKAAWWGGFWERLIGVLKALLRKILGRASLSYEELCTVVYECATYVNQRPLTYLSEDPADPVAISPQMFLQELPCNGLPDCDAADSNMLKRRIKRRLRLKEELKWRFRTEYLGQLHLDSGGFKEKRGPLVGEVVLIGSDDAKRIDWPLAVIEELIKGQDGRCRAVKLRTANGSVTRAIQHVYPLEIRSHDNMKDNSAPGPGNEATDEVAADPVTTDEDLLPSEDASSSATKKLKQKTVFKDVETRCGRKVRLPVRYAT